MVNTLNYLTDCLLPKTFLSDTFIDCIMKCTRTKKKNIILKTITMPIAEVNHHRPKHNRNFPQKSTQGELCLDYVKNTSL